MESRFVFAAAVLTAIISGLIYGLFILQLHDYGATDNRFLLVQRAYATIPPNATLFVGDSQVKEDVDCTKISALCYNIGVEGLLPVQVLLQAERIAQTHPRTVYLGVSVLTFHETMNKNDDVYFLLSETNDPIAVQAKQLLTAEENTTLQKRGISRFLYKRKFIVPHYLALFSTHTAVNASDPLRNPHAFTEPLSDEELNRRAHDPTIQSLFLWSTSSPREQIAFRELVAQLSKSTHVVIIALPTHPYIQPQIPATEHEAYLAYLRDTANMYGAQFVAVQNYTASDFIDLTHLNEQGRTKFSTELREKYHAVQ